MSTPPTADMGTWHCKKSQIESVPSMRSLAFFLSRSSSSTGEGVTLSFLSFAFSLLEACITIKMLAHVVFELTSERPQPEKLALHRDNATASTAMVVQCTWTRGAFQECCLQSIAPRRRGMPTYIFPPNSRGSSGPFYKRLSPYPRYGLLGVGSHLRGLKALVWKAISQINMACLKHCL